MNIEGVIFDLDGTLINTIEDIGDAANKMFEHYGLTIHPMDDFLKWIGNGAIKFIEKALEKDHSPEELKQYVTTFKEIYSQNLHNKSRMYEGIPDVLDTLTERGIKISVLSNKPHKLTKKVADYYLSGWPFSPVLGQREDVPRKPDPAAAFEIRNAMELEAGRILFIGDSDNDMLTALAAGMIPVGVNWGYGNLGTNPIEGVTRYIDHPGELIPLVLNER